MESIFNTIENLRNGEEITIDKSNSNRYRFVCVEGNGSKTAYYFGVPIYSEKTRRMLDMRFVKNERGCSLMGSNSSIAIGENILMENDRGSCRIIMPGGYNYRNEKCVTYYGVEVYPTTNGIACKAKLNSDKNFVFQMKLGEHFYDIKHNGKYFALMGEQFNPFVTVSCIGALDTDGRICSPISIQYKKISNTDFTLIITSSSQNSSEVLFEINLQESKLLQDTTVESKNPNQNNAFGGTAFIGSSEIYGEQWLYARPEFSKFNDLYGVFIKKAVLYIPRLNQNEILLSAHPMATRFCSFGSNWGNRKPYKEKFILSEIVPDYQKLDITNIIVQNQRLLTQSEGWILKSARKSSGFSAISTGDSFYYPQILEITFKE